MIQSRSKLRRFKSYSENNGQTERQTDTTDFITFLANATGNER